MSNLPPGMSEAHPHLGGGDRWECQHCEADWPITEERRECSVCGKTACIDCLVDCECGCGEDAHESCMVQYGKKFSGRKAYWLRTCIERHIAQLENDASDYLREADRAKQAIRRAA